MQIWSLTLTLTPTLTLTGEATGHYQMQIWRNWLHPNAADECSGDAPPVEVPLKERHGGEGLRLVASLPPSASSLDLSYLGWEGMGEQLALVLPTSLCSSEVARALARDLQASSGDRAGVRFVSLPHTEGCAAHRG